MIKQGKMQVAIPIIPVGFFLHDSYWSHPPLAVMVTVT
jgi:hypothetical protein